MSSMRQRNTYRFHENDDAEEERVLDEQEQEELIRSLMWEQERSDRVHLTMLRGVMLFAVLIQLIYFVTLTANPEWKEVPLSPVLSYGPQDLIPLPTGFTVLALALQMWEVGLLTPAALEYAPLLRAYSQYRFYPAAIAPLLSAVLWKNWAQMLWWSFPGFLGLIVWQARKWMVSGGLLVIVYVSIRMLKFKSIVLVGVCLVLGCRTRSAAASTTLLEEAKQHGLLAAINRSAKAIRVLVDRRRRIAGHVACYRLDSTALEPFEL